MGVLHHPQFIFVIVDFVDFRFSRLQLLRRSADFDRSFLGLRIEVGMDFVRTAAVQLRFRRSLVFARIGVPIDVGRGFVVGRIWNRSFDAGSPFLVTRWLARALVERAKLIDVIPVESVKVERKYTKRKDKTCFAA